MIAKRNGLKEDVQRVLQEILEAVDFDMEALAESAPEDVQALVFQAVLSVIDQEDVPFIDWIRMVEKEEADELKDDDGDFIPN